MSYDKYKKKTIKVLNDSVKWNIDRLPDNTLDMQLQKVIEEKIEAINTNTYTKLISELADVLIAIGGVERFDSIIAQDLFESFILTLSKSIYMDVVDQAERKIKELYERTYIIIDGVYRHKEIKNDNVEK